MAVERLVVQPAFAVIGQRHVSILKAHSMLQQHPAVVAAVFSCIGKTGSWPASLSTQAPVVTPSGVDLSFLVQDWT